MPHSHPSWVIRQVCTSIVGAILVLMALTANLFGQGSASFSSTNTVSREAAERHEEYRRYAETHLGDAIRGKAVFESEKKADCRKCHSADPNQKGVGPDLRTIGDKYERSELITSILEPSKTIAVGYGTTIVITHSGASHQGVLQRVTNEKIELRDKDGRIISLQQDEIDEQQESDVSLMPQSLESLMTRDEFADLIAYLATLRQAAGSGGGRSEVPDEIPHASKPARMIPFFDSGIRLGHPVWFGQIPGTENQYVVLEQAGRVWIVEKTGSGDRQKLMLELTRQVRLGGATGLLGMAFHPEFVKNRRYFLKYQINEIQKITTVVEERQWTDAETPESVASRSRRLLQIVGSTQDHNGGCIAFGPDGFLYVGMGDSGPQEDPEGHGQDLQTLLGKILRIDVDHEEGELPYAIPKDNPFLAVPKARPEIFAYGFREPWRFSFDAKTHELWVGDVGQNRFEEVAIVRPGENHGWNVHEGFADHSNRFRKPDERYVAPVLAYPRRLGVSVTGGYVYRGSRSPAMEGRYVFGDFESRRIWALLQKEGRMTDVVEIGRSPTRVVSFSEMPDGELCFVGYDTGTIYRLDCDEIDLAPLIKRTIVDTSETAPVLWRYSLDAQKNDWFREDFDDQSWKTGPGGFGTVGTPGGIIRTDWNTRDIWLRRFFTLTQKPAEGSDLALRVHHDEDIEVYVNGVEAVRLNRWTTGYVEIPLSENAVAALRQGENVIAIHCHQNGGGQYIDAGIVQFVRPAR